MKDLEIVHHHRFGKRSFLWLLVGIVLLFMIFSQSQYEIPHQQLVSIPVPIISTSIERACTQNLHELLSKATIKLSDGASSLVLLIFADHGIPIEILHNQIESMKRNNIPFLLAAMDSSIGSQIEAIEVGCYADETTFKYKNKHAQKLLYCLKILEKGHHVLFLDYDAVVTGNFVTAIEQLVETQQTQLWLQAPPSSHGMFLIRPYGLSIQLLTHITDRIKDNNEESVWEETLKLLPVLPFRLEYKYLPLELFTHWSIYQHHRNSWNPVVIRNHLEELSLEKFQYMLMESQHWYLTPDSYFSGKFLTYDCFDRFKFPSVTNFDYEANSLLNGLALSFLLNRTLVLPKFSCEDDEGNITASCSLESTLDVTLFMQHFGDMVRESSFLSNPRFPEDFRDRTASVFIQHGMESAHPKGSDTKLQKIALTPKDLQCGITDRDTRMITEKHRPLFEFPSMYGRFKKFQNNEEAKNFLEKVKKGISWKFRSDSIAVTGCTPWW